MKLRLLSNPLGVWLALYSHESYGKKTGLYDRVEKRKEVSGFSIHDELRILTENGFTPYEALAAGTVVASQVVKRMNGKDDFGTIAPGKKRDLILLQRNLLEDVAYTKKITGVMAVGRWYNQKAISEMSLK